MPATPTAPDGLAAPTTTANTAPRVRKDAARNRAHLLAAADKLIAERGLDITFHELAAAAGMGVGTVYRHFADRDALLGALIEERFGAARDLLLAAERIDDPIQALRSAVTGMCEMQRTDRGILQAMLSANQGLQDLVKEQLFPITDRIIARAKSTGRIRADFATTDLPMIFAMVGALCVDDRSVLWRRYVDTLLDGFMTADADRVGTSIDAPTEDEIERALLAYEPAPRPRAAERTLSRRARATTALE